MTWTPTQSRDTSDLRLEIRMTLFLMILNKKICNLKEIKHCRREKAEINTR